MKRLVLLIILCILICSCGSNEEKEIKVGKVTCSEMKEIMEKDDNARLIDVRTAEEYNEGHLDGAMNMPVDNIKTIQDLSSVNLDTPIIVYCRSGQRSSQAFNKLKELGYTKIYDLGAMANCSN